MGLRFTDRLPVMSTRFVGRGEEVGEIVALLGDPACRLLTVVGVGGVGKTRLALAVMDEVEESFGDGVAFVSLQPVHSVERVAAVVAEALDFSLAGQDNARTQLLYYLREKEILLVLDNFEQLLAEGGVMLLLDILRGAPRVKLLVTSCEVLNLQEEWLYPLQGLLVPQDDGCTDDLEQYGAVHLFIERARRVRPGFSLVEEQAGVARICQLVKGVPLAVELAASWVV